MRRELAVLGSNAAATIFLLLFAEGLSRWLAPTTAPSPLLLPEGLVERYVQPDRHLFWVVKPELIVEGETLTNRLGMRGGELGPKAAGEYFVDGLHPKAAGHALIAEAIAKRLTESWSERG